MRGNDKISYHFYRYKMLLDERVLDSKGLMISVEKTKCGIM
jgi:hypothetical protein